MHMQALCASVAAGLFGAFGSVMAKAVVEVFKQGKRVGWGTMVRRQAMWGIMTFACVVAITQVVVYNAALKYYKASVVMPAMLATLTLFGTMLGAVFFEEFRRWSTLALILLPIGVIVAFAGIIMLAIANPTDGPGEKEELEEKKALLGGASL